MTSRSKDVPVTRLAHPTTSRLSVVDGGGVNAVRHVVRVPSSACPVSGNPIAGVAVIRYTAAVSVEVVTLRDAMAWACSGSPGAPRSVETLAGWLRDQVTAAVGVPSSVSLYLLIRPGPQLLIVSR